MKSYLKASAQSLPPEEARVSRISKTAFTVRT